MLAHQPPSTSWVGGDSSPMRSLDQLAEGRDGLLRVGADRAHAQLRAGAGREREQREHALAAHPLPAARHLHLGAETARHAHELARRARVEAALARDHELALDGERLAHRLSSGRISLATEMLRCPYCLTKEASSSSGFSSRSVASLISIGRFTPVTTSTRRSPRNERLTFEGVPPNMSVSTRTP